jgi:hypothetical protein
MGQSPDYSITQLHDHHMWERLLRQTPNENHRRSGGKRRFSARSDLVDDESDYNVDCHA